MDRHRWGLGVKTLLDRLKPCVHEGAPLPQAPWDEGLWSRLLLRRADTLQGRGALAAALVQACCWTRLAHEHELQADLDAVHRLLPTLQAVPELSQDLAWCQRMLLLCREHGGEHVARLMLDMHAIREVRRRCIEG